MSIDLHVDAVAWPPFVPVERERVRAGSPATSTVVIHRDERSELGLWRVTPGEFSTVRTGCIEYIHVVAGEGDLVGNDGVTEPLRPGATVLLEDGWAGHWLIRSTITKSYAIIPTTTSGNV